MVVVVARSQGTHIGSKCGYASKQTGQTWLGCFAYIRKHNPEDLVLENVVNLHAKGKAKTDQNETQTMLDRIMKDLAIRNYSSIALKLSPHNFGVPQHRWRWYVVATRVLSLNVLRKEVEGKIPELQTDEMMPVDSFLLAENNPYIQKCLERKLQRKSETYEQVLRKTEGKKKWKKEAKIVDGQRPVTSIYAHALSAISLPWLETICERELQVLLAGNTSTNRWLNLSQKDEMSSFSATECATLQALTPDGLFFDRVLHRPLLAVEGMAFNGVFLNNPETEKRHSEGELQDVGGNAFPGFIVMLLTVALDIAKSKHARAEAEAMRTDLATVSEFEADASKSVEQLMSEAKGPDDNSTEPTADPLDALSALMEMIDE